MRYKHCLWQYGKAFYWGWETLRRKIIGTYIDEHIWQTRIPTLSRDYAESLNHPHRKWLVERVLSGGLASEIIEIGCGCGPNLDLLAHHAPHIRLAGIDISTALLAEGAAHFSSVGLGHIRLVEGKADNLIAFADASADVVFTDAMLLYVGPDKIKRVVQEMLRVARSRLVMLEMHDQTATSHGRYTRDGWVRNYEALLNLFVGKDAVRLEKLPPGLRTAGRWPKYGTLIEVDLTKKEKDIA